MPNRVGAMLGAAALALGLVGAAEFEVYEGLGIFNGEAGTIVHGISHFLESSEPHEYSFGEVQTALSFVKHPQTSQVIEGGAKGQGTLGTFDSVPLFGFKAPGTTRKASVTRVGTVEIMAPPYAITNVTAEELPNSTSSNPKYGAVVTVNADSLYPVIYDPITPIHKGNVAGSNSNGAPLRVKYLLFNDSTDGKYTSVDTVVTDENLKVKCAQAMASLVPAGIQQGFYETAQASEKHALPLEEKLDHGQDIAQATKDIASEKIPVQVNLVNAEGQPLNPTTFLLNDANYIMSNKAIALALGASASNTSFNFSGGCNSPTNVVNQMIAMQTSYLAHAGDSPDVSADNVTGNNG